MIIPFASHISNAIRRSLSKEQQEEYDSACEKLRDKLDDVEISISVAANKLKNIYTTARDNSKQGFVSSEIWNFGDLITMRMANICAYLIDAEYDTIPPYMDELRETEAVLRAMDLFNSCALNSATSAQIISTEKYWDFHEKNNVEKLQPAWEWIFKTLMNPDVYIAPKDNDTIIDKIQGKFTHEISYDDVKNLPVTEMRRMSSILKRFAENCYGYSENYLSSEKSLKTVEERGGTKWEQGQSFSVGLLTHHGSYWRESLWNKNNGLISQKNRKEIGLDWVAWIEDILHASNVLKLYADWNDSAANTPEYDAIISKRAHLNTLRDTMFLLDVEAAQEIENGIMEETQRVWSWLGRNIQGFWD